MVVRQGEEDLELQFGSQIKRRCCESSVGTEITHISRVSSWKNRNHSRYFMWREFNLRNELQKCGKVGATKGEDV